MADSTAPRRLALLAAALMAVLALALGVVVAGPGDPAAAAVVAAKPPDKPGKPGGGGGGGTTELEYAAIGDSFAAGTGGRSYLDTSCYRSANGYPKLLDADANLRLVAFPACSGASTVEVLAQQVPAVPSSARVVTVTVGGNDVGFGTVMQNCFVFVTSSCASHIANGSTIAASDGFATSIRNVVAAVKAKAPTAKVIVTGYPLLFHLPSKYSWADEVNAETVALNEVIRVNAVAAGAVFVDAAGPFTGHGIGSPAPWVNDWSWLRTADGFHPNATGYAAYAAAVRLVPVP
ncbi:MULTISPECIES: SGNH/GDSL hydrolase family protein [unclassified Agromyces]|uniref:SGNH/GDSL hydrolase family protein n=1 Tax=unclassified Agromyces TaxID=2639701 RepID=UPI003015064C